MGISGEALQLPLFPNRAYLQKIVPEANQKRFYAMTAIQTLFGEWAVMRQSGRIGSPGTMRVDFRDGKGWHTNCHSIGTYQRSARHGIRCFFHSPVYERVDDSGMAIHRADRIDARRNADATLSNHPKEPRRQKKWPQHRLRPSLVGSKRFRSECQEIA